jgi:hypothetical protein
MRDEKGSPEAIVLLALAVLYGYHVAMLTFGDAHLAMLLLGEASFKVLLTLQSQTIGPHRFLLLTANLLVLPMHAGITTKDCSRPQQLCRLEQLPCCPGSTRSPRRLWLNLHVMCCGAVRMRAKMPPLFGRLNL